MDGIREFVFSKNGLNPSVSHFFLSKLLFVCSMIMAPIVLVHVAPALAIALRILRYGCCSKLVGLAMATQPRLLIVVVVAYVTVHVYTPEVLVVTATRYLSPAIESWRCTALHRMLLRGGDT